MESAQRRHRQPGALITCHGALAAQVGRQTAQEKAAGPTSRLTLEQAPPSAGYDRDFSDTYELGQPLGAGSFKTVFVGRHRRTGDRVAVQVIAKDREGTTAADNVARIQKEVRLVDAVPLQVASCSL